MSRLNRLFPSGARTLGATLALGAAAVLALTGCSAQQTDEQAAHATSVMTVAVGDLASVDGQLVPGEEVHVLIDTPGLDWTVVSDAPEVVQVSDDQQDQNPRIVRVIAGAVGTGTVAFTAVGEAAADIAAEVLTITVSEEDAA